jgi:hypothetical protein
VQEVMGGVLGIDAGSTIRGYKIAGIGHGLHMRFGSLSRIGFPFPNRACIIWGWVWLVCCLSGYPKKLWMGGM